MSRLWNSVLPAGFQSYSGGIPVESSHSCGLWSHSCGVQCHSCGLRSLLRTPADSGATPAESGDSFWNQWGTEKYWDGS